jgi:hypothetical protein
MRQNCTSRKGKELNGTAPLALRSGTKIYLAPILASRQRWLLRESELGRTSSSKGQISLLATISACQSCRTGRSTVACKIGFTLVVDRKVLLRHIDKDSSLRSNHIRSKVRFAEQRSGINRTMITSFSETMAELECAAGNEDEKMRAYSCCVPFLSYWFCWDKSHSQ